MAGVQWPAVSTVFAAVQLTVAVVSARVGLAQLRDARRATEFAATRDLVSPWSSARTRTGS